MSRKKGKVVYDFMPGEVINVPPKNYKTIKVYKSWFLCVDCDEYIEYEVEFESCNTEQIYEFAKNWEHLFMGELEWKRMKKL